MSLTTCPIAIVNAPVDHVWHLLADPTQYDLWWELRTERITPEGPAQPGQEIFANALALGRKWPAAHLTVQAVAPETWQLDLLTRLPLGISVRNHITCLPLDDHHTRVTFG